MSEAAQRKGKQKWAIEKPKLDNARRLRGIYHGSQNDDQVDLFLHFFPASITRIQ